MTHKPKKGAIVRHRDGRVGVVVERFVPNPAPDVVQVEWVGTDLPWHEAGEFVNIAKLEYVH